MNVCPYANERTTCDLPVAEIDQGGKIAYCKQCSEIAFRCASGHWNRAFAHYCTQCRQKLEKPAVWGMVSGNPQRTATLPKMTSIDSLNRDYGFNTGVVITEIHNDGDLPGLLAIDGLIIVPNTDEKRLDAYTIANSPEQKSLSLKWSIAFNEKIGYRSTPIYHGLHLYYVVSSRIMKQLIVGGEAIPVEMSNVDAVQIQPIPRSAPLKCYVNKIPIMVVGLEQGMLLLDLRNNNGNYIAHDFFVKNTVMSPAQCGEYIVFTSLQGQIFSFKTGEKFSTQLKGYGNLSFSAPVSIGEKVYFEALSDSCHRSLACFDPSAGKLTKATDLDNDSESNCENRRTLFTHPPLTDGKRLFVSDRYGKQVYIYDSEGDYSSKRGLPQNDVQYMFAPHLSIVVSNRIYSATSHGLTILELGQSNADRHQSLAMGMPTAPTPVARPIRYGDKLFILCKDRLICLDY